MRIRLKEMTIEEKQFRFTFEKEEDQHTVLAHVNFRSPWEHAQYNFGEQDLFLNEDGMRQAKELFEGFDTFAEIPSVRRSEVLETINNMTQSSFLAIPNEMNREIFFISLSTWAKQVRAPLEVHMADHPGYPLMVIVSNSFAMSSGHRGHVNEIINTIKHAIIHMELVLQPHPDSANLAFEEDELDFEHAEVFENQIDPEVEEMIGKHHNFTEFEEMGNIESGEVIQEEQEQTEEVAAAAEKVALDFEIEIPYKKLYSVNREWLTLLTIYTHKEFHHQEWLFSHIPQEWLANNQALQARWCFPEPLDAFRTLVGKHASQYSEEELRKQYRNFPDFVHEVELEGSKCIIESEQYGFLIVMP